MNSQPSTIREALLAEVLGDVQEVLLRLEQASSNAQNITVTLNHATDQYRSQVDDMVAQLRAETASIVLKTTEHAAQSLVGQQHATLEKAARSALQQVMTTTVLRRSRRDWWLISAVGALSGSLWTVVLLLLYANFLAA